MILLPIAFNTIVRQSMHRTHPVRTLMRSSVLCWLVLLALLFGMVASAVGTIHSHGLAALAAIDHDMVSDSDLAHGHSHEDEGATDFMADPGHPHHAHDHSHDKAHAVPEGVTDWILRPSAWHATMRSQFERMPVVRLDRPPRDTGNA
ncbi:MAG TPA: hypothetical protein PLR02_07525 [Rhodocyclaceae bacterium]|nr:hypothetical protein [Rhodocyclaceae bacterium]